eukprot:2116090-Pyramimonas_sp.AAC.1
MPCLTGLSSKNSKIPAGIRAFVSRHPKFKPKSSGVRGHTTLHEMSAEVEDPVDLAIRALGKELSCPIWCGPLCDVLP